MKKRFTHIELFAGCGGMSLGLDKAGFDLYMANELSPMAGETFAFNILQENLKELAEGSKASEKVLWLKSKFDNDDLKSRLRENPSEYEKGQISDIKPGIDLKDKLVIGNINDLVSALDEDNSILKKIQDQDIDLLAGGPPCQSFSLAGRREKDNQKNSLPEAFAKFAGMIQPKIVLLENVKGITSPFKIGEHKYYAWLEVAKAFSLEGFIPICFMLNSKYFGVPQNRPRFILLGIRENLFQTILKKIKKKPSLEILNSSFEFFEKVVTNRKNMEELEKISIKDLPLYDIEKKPKLFDGELFPEILTGKEGFISAEEAISDLIIETKVENATLAKSDYVMKLNKLFGVKNIPEENELSNHDIRRHSFEVQARFRWFQIISHLNGIAPLASKILSGQDDDEEKTKAIFPHVKNELMLSKGSKGPSLMKIKNSDSFVKYIKSIQTRKHSQRAIKADEPAPAQMTIPDDLCHYSPSELRTLTVREMARFQSFPDSFEFRSKVTTGGTQRSFEIPQYTQVGNAVPPLLAIELGKSVKNLLKLL